ncbi:MAG: MBL fold metallo-hydrolase [Planctomycetota bacterium]
MSIKLRVDSFVSLPFEENSYIVRKDGEKECFVVDPGFEPDLLLQRIDDLDLEVTAILNTHGHVDHIAGNGAMKERFPTAPLIIGAGDARMLTDPFLNLSALGGVSVVSPPADYLVHDGQMLEVLGLQWEVKSIPGHSPGHVVFIWNEGNPPIVFGGDVLFAGSVGRADFPGGDGRLLISGIRSKLYCLPPESIVYPGHGTPTSVGEEMATNPFTTGRFSMFD